MELRKELTYAASVDDVWTMISDERFRREVCEETHAREYDVSIDGTEDARTVHVSRQLESPDIAKRFVGDTMEVVQTEKWGPPAADGTRRADLSITIPGRPGSMHGTVVLAPSGQGAVETISGDIKVGVPLVGGKLEKEIAKAIAAAITTEGRVGTRWLAG